MGTSVKKTTFKQRIRKNDMKRRHKMSSELRKRARTGRRESNRFDRIRTAERPLEEMVAEVAEGSAIASREVCYDARQLTDLLLRPANNVQNNKLNKTNIQINNTISSTNTSKKIDTRKLVEITSNSTTKPVLVLSSEPLPADDAMALPEPIKELHTDEAGNIDALHKQGNDKTDKVKNEYRHHGQAYVFWERVGLHPCLIEALRTMQFTHPTPVQEEVLPYALGFKDNESSDDDNDDNNMNGQNGNNSDSETSEKKKKKKKTTNKGKKAKRSGNEKGATGSNQKDYIVSAETGSGKTLVFALPLLNNLLYSLENINNMKSDANKKDENNKNSIAEPECTDVERERCAKRVCKDANTQTCASTRTGMVRESTESFQRRLMHSLILSPTRELAMQIHVMLEQLTQFCPQIVIGCIVGGMAPEKQQRILNRHPHILICTPGRLWELVQENEGCYLGHSISRRLHYLVLDEADKMLQSGRFEELHNLLERIHCEVLPAGFVQEREEGALPAELDLEAGQWDEATQKFIPIQKHKQEQQQQKQQKQSTKLGTKTDKKKRKQKRTRDDDTEENDGKAMTHTKNKKGATPSSTEEYEEELEEEDQENEIHFNSGVKHKKDAPRPIPMPPDPPQHHRVITYVTSATLSLETNYERRDLKAHKSVIRTSNADTMNKVLQQLEIKTSQARIFTLGEQAHVVAKINETYLRCPEESKDLYLYYFLRTFRDARTVVFVNAISMLRRLVKLLEVLGIAVAGLHAAMQQRQRLKFIDKFKSGAIRVLIATDVASRGLDVHGLKYVVHYQVPRSTDAYIHRCGRTARCGGTGLSVLLVNAAEHVSFRKLNESLHRPLSAIELFAIQPTVVHQLHAHLRIARQIDKLQKEIDKSRAANQWVKMTSAAAELETDDMYDEDAEEVNREKLKAIKILHKELQLLITKFTGSFGGKGAFRTGAEAMGAQLAEQKLKERANRQALKSKVKYYGKHK